MRTVYTKNHTVSTNQYQNGIYRPQKTRAYPHEWIRSRSIYQIENTIVAIKGSKTYT